jgi:hypothetical protein
MSKEEAARVLKVRPNATRRQIENAYESLRRIYVSKSQYATDPREREVANNALGLLQEAYQTLTGTPAPISIKPHLAPAATPSLSIPRASLGGRPAQHRAPARSHSQTIWKKSKPHATKRQDRWAPNWSWPLTFKMRMPTLEKAVASLICAVMFLIALLILACG